MGRRPNERARPPWSRLFGIVPVAWVCCSKERQAVSGVGMLASLRLADLHELIGPHPKSEPGTNQHLWVSV